MTNDVLAKKVKAAGELRVAIAKLKPESYVRIELERRLVDTTLQIDAERERREEESFAADDLTNHSRAIPKS